MYTSKMNIARIEGNQCFHSCNSSETIKVKANNVQQSLEQSVIQIKDLIGDFEQLQIETDNYKAQLKEQKDKCESQTCLSAVTYKQMIAAKDLLIQHVASALTKLNETKNLSILNEVFKLLCGDAITMTPPSEIQLKSGDQSPSLLSPKKQDIDPMERLPLMEDSTSEIESTPGRVSPILTTKNLRLAVNASSPVRDKKKCLENWTNRENKIIKLLKTPPSDGKKKGTGKTRQMRFSIIRGKRNNVVDLTCSPESHHSKTSQKSTLLLMKDQDNEDTILPSPTSGTNNAFNINKSTITSEGSHSFKKPLPSKVKGHTDKKLNIITTENSCNNNITDMEATINVFNKAQRVPKSDAKQSPEVQIKLEPDDVTYCEADDGMSVLKDVTIDVKENAGVLRNSNRYAITIPDKRPLAENINATNTDNETVLQSSMSLLRPVLNINDFDDEVKRKTVKVNAEDKGLTVEKDQNIVLPGWTCNKCKNFYGPLYKDDPETLCKKMQACARAHRGRAPPRARTPPGFWNPRWQVPDDTEEFNRMNNAI